MRHVDKWISRVENLWAAVACIALLLMMLITVIDVVLRYVFNSPLEWSSDIVSRYLLVSAFFLTLSYALRKDVHVGIDFVFRRLPARSRRILAVVGNVSSLFFFSMILIAGVTVTWEAWSSQEVPFGGLTWPTWTSYVFVPLGVIVLVARILFQVFSARADLTDEAE